MSAFCAQTSSGELCVFLYRCASAGHSLLLSPVSQSRAALSLLGFCYYHIQDITNAAECYEQLTQLHPEVEEYKVYYAQSLYKAGAYPEATKASFALDNPSSQTKVQHTHTLSPAVCACVCHLNK